MKKTYRLDVDCPQCAMKAEQALQSMDEISDCSVNFMTQKVIIEFVLDEDKKVLKKAQKLLNRVDDDIVLYF